MLLLHTTKMGWGNNVYGTRQDGRRQRTIDDTCTVSLQLILIFCFCCTTHLHICKLSYDLFFDSWPKNIFRRRQHFSFSLLDFQHVWWIPVLSALLDWLADAVTKDTIYPRPFSLTRNMLLHFLAFSHHSDEISAHINSIFFA